MNENNLTRFGALIYIISGIIFIGILIYFMCIIPFSIMSLFYIVLILGGLVFIVVGILEFVDMKNDDNAVKRKIDVNEYKIKKNNIKNIKEVTKKAYLYIVYLYVFVFVVIFTTSLIMNKDYYAVFCFELPIIIGFGFIFYIAKKYKR